MRYIDLFEAPNVGPKKRTTDVEFKAMAVAAFGDRSAALSLTDLIKISDDNGVQIPASIRGNTNLKVDAHHWNLSGKAPGEADVDASVSNDLGVSVEKSEPSPEYADLLRLSKAKEVRRLTGLGRLYLFGRKPGSGAFFRVQGFEEYSAQLERMLSRELEAKGDQTMEEQYSLLQDKVELVAGGKSSYVKSLLVTGEPSSGKTYNISMTIKKLGLVEGQDYIVKKGRITVLSMYRTLIEQIDGLVVFDDCDSVVEDKNGINMLKGALDTDPVREISYDVRGTVNTASLSADVRAEYASRLSKALRYVETSEDTEFFRAFLAKVGLLTKILKSVKKKKNTDQDEDGIDDEYEEDESDTTEADLILNYVRTHLPNKIDFKGRIIFISNMTEDEWDSAILSRAFYQNMSFRSDEMLDFIDRIKGSMHTPGLTEDQKQEVIDFIRDLYTTGKLRRSINFRLIQQGFDLRLVTSWKQILSQM